jgi:hypothetical protein
MGDERSIGTRLDLLHCPGISIWISEAEECTPIAFIECGDLTGLDASATQLLPCRVCISDHKLQTPHGAGLHGSHARPIAEHDGAP